MRPRHIIALFVLAFCLAFIVSAVAEERYPGREIAEFASYANVTAADNNVVKSSAGKLQAIVINSVTTSGTITIYDNTVCAGAKIGTITAPFAGEVLTYGIRFTTGLCVNTGGSTNMDLTVAYH